MTVGVGLSRGAGRLGLFAGGATDGRFPTLGETERMSALDLAACARWRAPATFALVLGGGAGVSVRRYFVETDTLVGTALTPFVQAEAGLSWAPTPWLEVAPLARAAIDLAPTALEKGGTTLRQGGASVGVGLDLTFHPRTIP